MPTDISVGEQIVVLMDEEFSPPEPTPDVLPFRKDKGHARRKREDPIIFSNAVVRLQLRREALVAFEDQQGDEE